MLLAATPTHGMGAFVAIFHKQAQGLLGTARRMAQMRTLPKFLRDLILWDDLHFL